jgi:hypothetical protein
MNNLGLNVISVLDPILLILLATIAINFSRPKTIAEDSKIYLQISRKKNSILLLIFIPVFLLYDLILRNLNIDSLLGKFISLLQNWYPGKQIFMDGMWQGRQFKCSELFDIYSDQNCIPGKYNYPALYKIFPSWFGSNLFIYALIVIFCMGILAFSLNKIVEIPASLLAIFVFSPSVFFLLDRANFESISALSLLVVSIYASKLNLEKSSGKKIKFLVISSLFFLIFVLTKFFGILLAVPLIIFSKGYIRKYWIVFSAAMVSLTLFVLEFRKGIANAPNPSRSSLGLISIVHDLTELPIVFLIYTFILIFMFRKKFLLLIEMAWNASNFKSANKGFSLETILIVFVLCWILTDNVFYRAVLIAPYLIYKACTTNFIYYTYILVSISYFSTFTLLSNFSCLLLLVELLSHLKKSSIFERKIN